MKRKRFGAYLWYSILSKRYKQMQLDIEQFQGVAGLLYIDETTDYTSWEIEGKSVQVSSKGMKWLQLMPEDRTYAVTAMITPENTINLFYIDMIAGGGLDPEDGIVYFDDLYLDLIVHPSGRFLVDDRDELDEAYHEGDITKQQYEQALITCEQLQRRLSRNLPEFMEFCLQCAARLEREAEFIELPEKI